MGYLALQYTHYTQVYTNLATKVKLFIACRLIQQGTPTLQLSYFTLTDQSYSHKLPTNYMHSNPTVTLEFISSFSSHIVPRAFIIPGLRGSQAFLQSKTGYINPTGSLFIQINYA